MTDLNNSVLPCDAKIIFMVTFTTKMKLKSEELKDTHAATFKSLNNTNTFESSPGENNNT